MPPSTTNDIIKPEPNFEHLLQKEPGAQAEGQAQAGAQPLNELKSK